MSDPHGTAHDAVVPRELPVRAWKLILRRALAHFVASRFPLISAGIAFFAVLSIAPVLMTALSVYGAVNSPDQAMRQLAAMSDLLPPEMRPLVEDQLTSITAASTQVLTRRGGIALAIALWTATTAAVSLIDTLTLAYHETETRGGLRRTALGLAFVLGGAVLLAVVIAAAGLVTRVVAAIPGPIGAVTPVLTWPALAILLAVALSVLYRYGPDRKSARWQWISWGSTAAAVLWLATSLGLFAYVQRLGTYESTYGSLAGVAISMFWLWISVVLVLLGATVNGEAERQTSRDSTVGEERPLGQRGAVVADSVPPPPE
jgi:membrane protein